MRQIPVRELNQHTANVLALVEAGERIEITRRGIAVAVMVPAERNPLADLIDSGDVVPARAEVPLWSRERDGTTHDSAGVGAVMADRYGDGRW